MNVPPIGRAFTSEPGVFRLQWGCCHFALFPREFKRDVAVTGEDFRNENVMSRSPVGERYPASMFAAIHPKRMSESSLEAWSGLGPLSCGSLVR